MIMLVRVKFHPIVMPCGMCNIRTFMHHIFSLTHISKHKEASLNYGSPFLSQSKGPVTFTVARTVISIGIHNQELSTKAKEKVK